MMERARKFRQAAIVYLHVGILYEGAVYAMWRQGLLAGRGPEYLQGLPGWAWLLVGGALTALIIWGLWSWQNVWFARGVWLFNAVVRVPPFIQPAFFPTTEQAGIPTFYLAVLVAILINMWMLARAAWDL